MYSLCQVKKKYKLKKTKQPTNLNIYQGIAFTTGLQLLGMNIPLSILLALLHLESDKYDLGHSTKGVGQRDQEQK